MGHRVVCLFLHVVALLCTVPALAEGECGSAPDSKACSSRGSPAVAPILMQKGILHHKSDASSVEIRDIAKTIQKLDANQADMKKELEPLKEGVKDIQRAHTGQAKPGSTKAEQDTLLDKQSLAQRYIAGQDIRLTEVSSSAKESAAKTKMQQYHTISAPLIGPGQASMANDYDLSMADKVAVGTLDFVATGAHTEYCKSWLRNGNGFICEFGAIFLGLLICTPLIALSIAAFAGIVSGFKSLHH